MAVVSATTTGGTSATSVGLSLLGTSLKLPPVSSVLVPEQSINDVLTTLLPANPTTRSSVVPGVDVSSTAPPGLSEVVPGVDVSSTAPPGLSEVVPGVDVSPAVPPDLSEVVPGDFDVSVEPHEGEAATTSTGEERTADEEDTPVCKLCVCVIGFFCCCCCFFFFIHAALVFNLLVSVSISYHSCVVGSKVFPFRKTSVRFMESSPKLKRTTRAADVDATLSGWSGAEDVSFSATPVSPEVMQLGRQLASTVEERTVRQIQTGELFICDWPLVGMVCCTLRRRLFWVLHLFDWFCSYCRL